PATCNELRAKYSNGTKGPEFGQYCPSRSEALGYMTGEGRMLIGYARVSKADGSQTTDLQRDALLAAGIDSEQIYEDQASGKQDDRPQLAACLKALRHGDTLIVWKLDRLGRDLRQLCRPVGVCTRSDYRTHQVRTHNRPGTWRDRWTPLYIAPRQRAAVCGVYGTVWYESL